jgi:hypothetical protein
MGRQVKEVFGRRRLWCRSEGPPKKLHRGQKNKLCMQHDKKGLKRYVGMMPKGNLGG